MTDVPEPVMQRYRRLRRMADLAFSTSRGAYAAVQEAQAAWDLSWNQCCGQLAIYGFPVLTEDGRLVFEVRHANGRTDVVEHPGMERYAAELTRRRDELREARAQVAAAGAAQQPLSRLADEAEKELEARFGWVPDPGLAGHALAGIA